MLVLLTAYTSIGGHQSTPVRQFDGTVDQGTWGVKNIRRYCPDLKTCETDLKVAGTRR